MQNTKITNIFTIPEFKKFEQDVFNDCNEKGYTRIIDEVERENVDGLHWVYDVLVYKYHLDNTNKTINELDKEFDEMDEDAPDVYDYFVFSEEEVHSMTDEVVLINKDSPLYLAMLQYNKDNNTDIFQKLDCYFDLENAENSIVKKFYKGGSNDILLGIKETAHGLEWC